MKQCPNAYLADVWPMVRWYTDWKLYRALPYPGDVLAQPYFVKQVFDTCHETEADIAIAREKKAKHDHEKWLREINRRNRMGGRVR